MKPEVYKFWEEDVYSEGRHLNRYPYDRIVSFIFRYFPRFVEKASVKILEMGSGAGNNLWFAAREGFSITGVELSETAINFSKKRFLNDGLNGDFIQGNFTELPLSNGIFDLVFDRASITCCSYSDAVLAINEVHRVLKKAGYFYFNPYSDLHASANSGTVNEDGTIGKIKMGTLKGIENISFFNRTDIDNIFSSDKWNVISIRHIESVEQLSMKIEVHAEWEVIVQKN